MTGIYKIMSPSNKIYIGQSHNITSRWNQYKYCKSQPVICRSLQKYGIERHQFEVIHELPEDIEQSVLDNYEVLYWQLYKEAGFIMLNSKEPGIGGKLEQITKDKIATKLKGNKNSLGYKWNEAQLQGHKIRMNNRTWRPTEEWREKIRKSKTGVPNLKLRGRDMSSWIHKITAQHTDKTIYLFTNSKLGKTFQGTKNSLVHTYCLDRSHIGQVINKTALQHKGWTVYEKTSPSN